MNRKTPLIRPVRMLNPEIARKIAAGEVIDRPAAIVRELLDNALDSGADSIQLEIENGGISLIRVVDTGCGMTGEDLKNCAQPHATSKIITDDDLLSLQTLGFRGEALASIAAVSELEITSKRTDENHAWKLQTNLLEKNTITPANLAQGTVVVSRGLFENIPARRSFLKRPAFEAQMCRQVFAEKALPWNEVSFKLIVDGKQKLSLPAGQSLTERFTSAMGISEPSAFFYEVTGGSDSPDSTFNFTCILCDSAVRRSDRKSLYVFINGRRIWEYSLVQAIEYGSQGYFPNGTFPIACLFLTVNPRLVDFNIHPAKKEVRFKDISPIHRAVSSAVRDFYKSRSITDLAKQAHGAESFSDGFDPTENKANTTADTQNNLFTEERQSAYGKIGTPGSSNANRYAQSASFRQNKAAVQEFSRAIADIVHYKFLENISNTASSENKTQSISETAFRYVGTVLGVFLLAEKDDTLYLIDQHAAQERILYEQFFRSLGQKQALLFPYVIETANETDDHYIENLIPELEKAGFSLKNCGSGRWEVNAIPVKWHGTEEDLTRDLLENRVQPQDLSRRLAAMTACRAAVKDGTMLDNSAAISLIAQTFALLDPHCPHGRPIWTTITKEELFAKVRRIEGNL